MSTTSSEDFDRAAERSMEPMRQKLADFQVGRGREKRRKGGVTVSHCYLVCRTRKNSLDSRADTATRPAPWPPTLACVH